jgi:hydroxymethylpyrimidine pyrophosphatase-like HAD family hydrolase
MSMLSRPLVLAITLDESFATAAASERERMLGVFDASAEDLKLVYMSHESSGTLIQLAARAELPVPAMFLADSGTTALKGDGTGTIEPLQRNIIQLWPGKDSVTRALKDLPGVKLVDDDAPCRQAIEIESDEAFETARAKADEIGCHLSTRRGTRRDVLPFGVDLGSSLGRWMVQENISPANVLAVGQYVGDASLFGRGWRGALFAQAQDALRAEAGSYHNVYTARTNGPQAVMDGLRYFGWLAMSGVA